jgi:hypothetical protein
MAFGSSEGQQCVELLAAAAAAAAAAGVSSSYITQVIEGVFLQFMALVAARGAGNFLCQCAAVFGAVH